MLTTCADLGHARSPRPAWPWHGWLWGGRPGITRHAPPTTTGPTSKCDGDLVAVVTSTGTGTASQSGGDLVAIFASPVATVQHHGNLIAVFHVSPTNGATIPAATPTALTVSIKLDRRLRQLLRSVLA